MPRKERQHKMGPVGECICPKCQARIPHRRSMRCQEEHCPDCGARMLRVGSDDYQLWRKKHWLKKHWLKKQQEKTAGHED